MIIIWKWDDVPDAPAQVRYLCNRAALLSTLLLNHVAWKQSLAECSLEASFAARWVDVEGCEQVSAISQLWLRPHRRIVNAVTLDLPDGGEAGQTRLHEVMSDQLVFLDDGESLAS